LVDGHTLDVAVDDEVVAIHPFHCLDDAYEDDVVMAVALYLLDVMDDIPKSSHLEHHDFHYCHYLVVTSYLSYLLSIPGELKVNLLVHHSVILLIFLVAVVVVAAADIHFLLNLDYHYHFVNALMVEMPLFHKYQLYFLQELLFLVRVGRL
jgi:hypothetical protein